ncbi:LPS-assembly lipoprotein LptE [Leeia aquatica]|uniref:LPS-assembly lipoprotein LptE n=1 Tax=Leeia aquatica TaxID=2725557 RepID=A0A847SB68_9NEIS|nr:LPS assembly lipoprotein LptE [Leeia aquatica]NLR76145.1 hypothetical protein [Leeia aquatica]
MRTLLSRLCLLGLLGLLAGCGFHLRGAQPVELPFKQVFLAKSGVFQLDLDAQRTLSERGGVEVLAQSSSDAPVLDSLQESRNRNLRSVNIDGKVKEYELQYTFSFRLRSAAGETLLQNQISLVRRMSYSDDALLAKEQEENRLYLDMRQDALQQMLRRLAHAPVGSTPAAH